MTEQNQSGGLPSNEAIDLAQAVSYADAATVSRIVAKSKAGNITLFAFDAGQYLSEHQAPYDAHVIVLEGEAGLTIGGKPVRASAGQIVVMPANVPHALLAITKMKMMLVMLKG